MKNRAKRIELMRMATTTITIQGNVTWTWNRTRRGSYIAVCRPIGQTVQAERWAELLESIDEVLGSTFKELLSTGDFERFLKERGWSCGPIPTPRIRRNLRFEMPFNLKGTPRRDLEEAIC